MYLKPGNPESTPVDARTVRRQALQEALEVVKRSVGQGQCVDGILELLRHAPVSNGQSDPMKALEAFFLVGVLNSEHQETLTRNGYVQQIRGRFILTSTGRSVLERLGY